MDNFDPALISVVMPCYNDAPYVEEAIGSVHGQSYPHVELIVVDDGSTDGSSEILQRLAAENPGRVTLIYQNRTGDVYSVLVNRVLPPGLKGVVAAALLAALMSTVS